LNEFCRAGISAITPLFTVEVAAGGRSTFYLAKIGCIPTEDVVEPIGLLLAPKLVLVLF